MTEDSIDFQPLPDAVSNETPVRKSFRVPVSHKENILAIIDGHTYQVANISKTGIAIHADSCLEFDAGQILSGTELLLGTQRLKELTGKVIHCSVHDGGFLQFGIKWQGMSAQDVTILENAIVKLKDQALKQE
ncbi:MAG TPA: hypothetical protein DHV36_07455 [Desulfobacteraceae bacterium]|nr:hypothetical protein [Desulfobacteraceae bacterium]|tara:strand:+ start:1057 stop:1455 length:399 start_codon:yes stop_codon:yes gene_type:complete